MASQLIIYQTEDGNTKIQTRLENESVIELSFQEIDEMADQMVDVAEVR